MIEKFLILLLLIKSISTIDIYIKEKEEAAAA